MSLPPKTPDAMDHMPEERKEEYRWLKEQLARREKRANQPRQPLSTINQERERSPEASHLAALDNQVKESEATISKHKWVGGSFGAVDDTYHSETVCGRYVFGDVVGMCSVTWSVYVFGNVVPNAVGMWSVTCSVCGRFRGR